MCGVRGAEWCRVNYISRYRVQSSDFRTEAADSRHMLHLDLKKARVESSTSRVWVRLRLGINEGRVSGGL